MNDRAPQVPASTGNRVRRFIAFLGALGVLVFGGAFVASWMDPVFVESFARDMVRIEVEKRVDEKIDTLEGSRIVTLAARISGRNAEEVDDIKRALAAKLPRKIAAIATEMRDPNCTCRKAIEKFLANGFVDRALELGHIEERLSSMIRSKYIEVAASLTREFRIFTGANAIVFALLGSLALLRRRAAIQLVLPAVVLVGAALIVGYLYLFQQDWLHTIVFGDYVGFAYFAYLGIAVAFLVDIAFNRARITTLLINAAINIVGGAFQVLPC